MKLYVFPPAPNPRKVLTYLAEKGLAVPLETVNLLAGEQRSEAFLARNPMGKLPVLELDDGSCIAESLAIIEYLEELHPEPSMWGDTPEARLRARAWERYCDLGVLASTGRLVHAANSPLGLPANPAVAEAAQEARQEALRVLDAQMGDAPFVVGERVTVADCTLLAALEFGELFGAKLDPAFANVTRWLASFRERPSSRL